MSEPIPTPRRGPVPELPNLSVWAMDSAAPNGERLQVLQIQDIPTCQQAAMTEGWSRGAAEYPRTQASPARRTVRRAVYVKKDRV